jgi:hypothetical protein
VKRSRLVVAAVAVAVPLLVSACGTPTAGAAAVIGDRRVTEADVQRATADIQAKVGAANPVPQAQVLFFLIAAPDVVDAANRAGVGFSLDDARTDLETTLVSPSEPGATVWQASKAMFNINNLPADRSGQVKAALIKVLRSHTVTVNPRYGSFDPKTVSVGPAVENWIVGDAGPDAAAATPAGS